MLEASAHPLTNVNTQTAGLLLFVGLLGACSQGEPQPVASRPQPPIPQAAPVAKPPAPSPEVMPPAKSTPAVAEPAAAKAQPPRRKAEPTPARPPETRRQPEPARPPAPIAPDGRSREQLALVPPAGFVEPARVEAPVKPAAASSSGPVRVMNRIEPDFPRAAFQARVDRGIVKARMTLDDHGNVTRVDIVEAQPRRLFDNTVVAALSQWKFNDGASGRTYDTEVVFRR